MALRVAVVGLGKIARDQHLPALQAVPGLALAAVVSRNAVLDGVPCFQTLEALFASGTPVDAVALCTPPQVRRRQAETALATGKHVLLEKPPGSTMGEVVPLAEAAARLGVTLFATWHSRFAPGVETARAWLAARQPRSIDIRWKEDVRVWHPGQAWIFEPGGLGVFDPGINALSILTRILGQSVFVTAAALDVPSNCAAPIAATLEMTDPAGTAIRAEFDFLQAGPQTWDIEVRTDGGCATLSRGGAELRIDGQQVGLPDQPEYHALYTRFRDLCTRGASDVDLSPLGLVADAFLVGRHRPVAPFHG